MSSMNRLNKGLLNQLVSGKVAFVATSSAGPRYLYVDSSLAAKSKTSPDEELEKNPYYKKYAEKIAAARKSNEVASHPIESPVPAFVPPRKLEATPRARLSTNQGTVPRKKFLDDVLKTELLVDKSTDEISHIWREFHKNKDCLSAVLPGKVYKLLRDRGRRYPTFLLPLPRSQGYEFVVTQFDENEVHMTLLINYQTHKENAPECLNLVYYPDILETKDIVPMRGEYDSNSLSILEAQCLANTLQLYYGEEDSSRTQLMENFTRRPDGFNHMDLINQMESLGFGETKTKQNTSSKSLKPQLFSPPSK